MIEHFIIGNITFHILRSPDDLGKLKYEKSWQHTASKDYYFNNEPTEFPCLVRWNHDLKYGAHTITFEIIPFTAIPQFQTLLS